MSDLRLKEVTVNGQKLLVDQNGTQYKKDDSGNISVFKGGSQSSTPSLSSNADTSGASVFSRKGENGRSAKITILDSDKDGFDNNDSITFEGDISLYSPDELEKILKDKGYKNSDKRNIQQAFLNPMSDNTVNTEANKKYSVGSFMDMVKSNREKEADSKKLRDLRPGMWAAYEPHQGDGGVRYINDAFHNINAMLDDGESGQNKLRFNSQSNSSASGLGTNGNSSSSANRNSNSASSSNGANSNRNNGLNGANSSNSASGANGANRTGNVNANQSGANSLRGDNSAEASKWMRLANDKSKYLRVAIEIPKDVPKDKKDLDAKLKDENLKYKYLGSVEKKDGTTQKVYLTDDKRIAVVNTKPGKENRISYYTQIEKTVTGQEEAKNAAQNAQAQSSNRNRRNRNTHATQNKNKNDENSSSKSFMLYLDKNDTEESIRKQLKKKGFSQKEIDSAIKSIMKNGKIEPGSYSINRLN